MAQTPPIIEDETLTYQQADTITQMLVGSPGWYA
jgi:hypothetical protein